MADSAVSSPMPSKPAALETPLPGARLALVLLLSINLFNYIDRQVLAAVELPIEKTFFPEQEPSSEPNGVEEPQDGVVSAIVKFLSSALGLEGKRAYAKAMMGLLATAFMFSYMITAPLFGWLAERTSRWLLIGVGVILWSLASGASGLAPTFAVLLLTRCLVGVGEGAYGPAAPTVISDLYPARVRSTMLGWFYMAIPVGSALGYLLGGQVLTWIRDWRWAFYLVVVPGILLGIWSMFMRDPSRGRTDTVPETGRRRGRLKDYWTFLRTPSYVLNTVGMTAMTFAAGGLAFWMPRYVFQDRGLYKDLGEEAGLGRVNLIFGVMVVTSGLVATLLGGILGDWLRPRIRGAYFVISGISMLLAFPMILLVLWTPFAPFPWAWIFVFLSVFCLYFNTGPTNTILANVTHPAVRASAFAINIFIIHALGDAVSPLIIGLIAGHSSLHNGFVAVSATVLVGGLAWLCGARYLDRDTALAPTRLGDNAAI